MCGTRSQGSIRSSTFPTPTVIWRLQISRKPRSITRSTSGKRPGTTSALVVVKKNESWKNPLLWPAERNCDRRDIASNAATRRVGCASRSGRSWPVGRAHSGGKECCALALSDHSRVGFGGDRRLRRNRSRSVEAGGRGFRHHQQTILWRVCRIRGGGGTHGGREAEVVELRRSSICAGSGGDGVSDAV